MRPLHPDYFIKQHHRSLQRHVFQTAFLMTAWGCGVGLRECTMSVNHIVGAQFIAPTVGGVFLCPQYFMRLRGALRHRKGFVLASRRVVSSRMVLFQTWLF